MQLYSYPQDLVDHLERNWPDDVTRRFPPEALYDVFAVAYHASFLRDENRPVRLRMLVAAPEHTPAEDDGPSGVLRWRLEKTRPLVADELRRIAPAAPFESALVCVDPGAGDRTGTLWGLSHSGAGWLAPTTGGRRVQGPTHDHLVVHVVAPGRLAVFAGERFLVELEGGELHDLTHDVFDSTWLPAAFAQSRVDFVAQLDTAIDHHGRSFSVDPKLAKYVSQQLLKRVLALLRTSRHGGMLLFVDRSTLHAPLPSCVRVKYALADEAPRRRHRALLEKMVRELASRHASLCETSPETSWKDLLRSPSAELVGIEQNIFELARFVAGLTSVDGAVVLDKRIELLGFGAEVLHQSDTYRVYRALDGEAIERFVDDEESVGTRHRAAYRFVHAHPRGLAIVVSQDGGVRFVTQIRGEVTYFEQKLVG